MFFEIWKKTKNTYSQTLMAAYRRVQHSRHPQADCQEPVSAPEPYAWQSSMGYLYLSYICIWRPRWGWPRWNFAKIFGIRKLVCGLSCGVVCAILCLAVSVELRLATRQGHSVHCRVVHTRVRLTALCSGLPGWAGTRKVKPIWILLKQESEWQWHQLGCMQVCTLSHLAPHRQPHQHPTTLFLQAGCPSCRPTNSVNALKAYTVVAGNKNNS